jgi:C-terminal processing protease CtpA/Prc
VTTWRTTGSYGGVGLTIGKDEGGDVIVLAALEGFAFDEGIRPGDRLLEVAGKEVRSLSVEGVKELLRGVCLRACVRACVCVRARVRACACVRE